MANVYFKDKIPGEFEGMRKYAKAVADENLFVVHDLYPFDPSSGIGFLEKWKQKNWYKEGIRKNEKVRIFSQHTREALEQQFPEAKEKTELVVLVADSECYQNDEDARDAIRYQYTQGDAYFLYRGPVHAAANIIPLLKGFSIFKKKIGSNMRLVLCGPQGPYSAEILAAVDTYKYRTDLIWITAPTAWEEQSLLSSAYALVHPCRWERFGIPIFNAMKSGVAVLTAENSSMSEFAGMAGMFFNEKDANDIGDKLIRIYKDEQVRAEMIGTGLTMTQQ